MTEPTTLFDVPKLGESFLFDTDDMSLIRDLADQATPTDREAVKELRK